MKPAISVENLSKNYRLGQRLSGGYRDLRDVISGVAQKPLNWFRSRKNGADSGIRTEDFSNFWALRDVSFEIQPGEVVGIIGRNGAGKSTLLKILSRVVEPTSGRAVINGRVGSLLEVGTGFHPDLTGRENIYLNGSILGMSRVEINSKLNEIIAFSGVEQFIDTPVKRYSSGMQVRLAFAVAAHLEPEILIIDEVLAVGDAEFQKRCLGKMKEVACSGRTILFVSHSLGNLKGLCCSGVLLEDGKLRHHDTIEIVADKYENSVAESLSCHSSNNMFSNSAVIKSAQLVDGTGKPMSKIKLGQTFVLELKLTQYNAIGNPKIGIGIDSSVGIRMLTVHTPATNPLVNVGPDDCTIRCTIRDFPLPPGWYTLKIAISGYEEVSNVCSFLVVDADLFNEGRGFHKGVCVARSVWSIY